MKNAIGKLFSGAAGAAVRGLARGTTTYAVSPVEPSASTTGADENTTRPAKTSIHIEVNLGR